MNDPLKGLLLDEFAVVSRSELCANGWVTPEELDVLAALGVIPERADGYPAVCLSIVRRAARLKRGLEADWESVAVIMDLLQEIEALKSELYGMKARERPRLSSHDAPDLPGGNGVRRN